MSQTLRKRGREPEALPASTDVREAKRIHGEETDRFYHLLQLDKTVAQEEEACAPSEEVVNGIMRSLEEEIGATCFTSDYLWENSASSDISSGQEGETLTSDSDIDLFCLLEASDDELGIPLSPVLELKDEVQQSPKETCEGLLENQDLKSLDEIWPFEDDFEKNQQICFNEDGCTEASQLQDYMNRDFVSQDMFFEGEFSATWTLETGGFLL